LVKNFVEVELGGAIEEVLGYILNQSIRADECRARSATIQ
jgi:hypothetical protein